MRVLNQRVTNYSSARNSVSRLREAPAAALRREEGSSQARYYCSCCDLTEKAKLADDFTLRLCDT
eukprot:5686-Heterococcus_DN1.PRE.1